MEVIDVVRELGREYKDKIGLSNDLLNCVSQFCEVSGGITGSFPRQIFELPFMLATFDLENAKEMFGNPAGKDLDMVIYDGVYDEYETRKKIEKFAKMINSNLNDISFGNYVVRDIVDATMYECLPTDSIGKQNLHNIPHYQIDTYHKDNNKRIILDILGWYPDDIGGIKDGKHKYNPRWKSGDFDVNTIVMSRSGFRSRIPDTFTNIMHSIENREAKCAINLELINNEIPHVSSNWKISHLKQLGHFMGTRSKIVENGYKMIGTLPNSSIELEETCLITSSEAPYVKYKLKCGHEFSVGSLMMVLGTDKENAPTLCCFLCREAFRIDFVKTEPSVEPVSYIKYTKEKDISAQDMKHIGNEIANTDTLEDIIKQSEKAKPKDEINVVRQGHLTVHPYG